MTRLACCYSLRRAAYLLATLFLLAVGGRPAAAQGFIENSVRLQWTDQNGTGGNTEAYAIILGSTDQSEIYTQAETHTSYSGQWYNWDVEVEGDLYCDDQLIDSQYQDVWNGNPGTTALVNPKDPVEVGHWYNFYGYHFVDYDEDYLGDPLYPISGEFDTWTYVAVYTSAPSISSINPTSASLGTSPSSIEVNGGNLVDPFNCAVSPALTDPSIQLTSDPSNTNNFIMEPGASCNATTLTIDYSIGPNASAGNQTFTLANRFGTSNGMAFTVYDPTPAITSVITSPNPYGLQAGVANQTVTINGSNFGTNPSVTFGDSNILIVGTPSVSQAFQGGGLAPAQTITLQVTVGAQDPGGTSSVTVTSGGYGNGLTTPPPGGTLSASSAINTIAVPATPPQIYQGPNTQGDGICGTGTNITNTTQQVFVGQQVGFSACVPSMQLAEITITRSWTMPSNWSVNALGAPQAAAVANWTVTNPAPGCQPSPPSQYCNYGATLTPVATAPPSCGGIQSCDFYTYFFVVPGTYTFTYSYTAPGGSNSSSVTYVASGPTNVNVTPQEFSPVTLYTSNIGNPVMGLGDAPGFSGIELTATFTPPAQWQPNANSTMWVQVFTKMRYRDLNGAGTWTGYSSGQIAPTGVIYGEVLDTVYPYSNGSSWYDDPQRSLQDGELSRDYSAMIYLMWDPAFPQGCTPATHSGGPDGPTASTQCTKSIPVPLGIESWGACGDAVNTLTPQASTGTNWLLNCSSGSSETGPSFIAGTTYPSWQSTIYRGEQTIWTQP